VSDSTEENSHLPMNPYQAPLLEDEPLPDAAEGVDAELEAIRKKLIKHETSIRSIALIYFIGAAVLVALGINLIFQDRLRLSAFGYAMGPIFLGLASLLIWVGIALRRLQPWSRVAVGLLSGAGLLQIPVGTVIHAYILYLVFCKKGSAVFDPAYKKVIAATPHIKYKTSKIAWFFLGLLFFLLAWVGLLAFLDL